MSTVNAQAGITSAPPAASIFIAMAQGAVYGAVNAVDRHGRPYLVNRSFPMASKDAAAATAAFLVLDDEGLFRSSHAMLQAAYDASLATIPDGALKENGIAVGTMAAEAMLAEGHDGRTFIRCVRFRRRRRLGATRRCHRPNVRPGPWVANAVPFMVKSPSQFRTAGPPRWRVLPTRTSSTRSRRSAPINSVPGPAQSHAAAFWQTNPAANFNAWLAGSSISSPST